jgi:tRNA threonylcarbamoyladenosine biosynthesis protein TsaE
MNFQIQSPNELEQVADAVLSLIEKGYTLFLLTGDLGSGKTTLVKEIARKLNVEEAVSSPTFSLVNEYHSPSTGILYHMDFYRLEKTTDLIQVGLEEYLVSGHICFIEWPGIADGYFLAPYVQIRIQVDTNNIRTFNITTDDTVGA